MPFCRSFFTRYYRSCAVKPALLLGIFLLLFVAPNAQTPTDMQKLDPAFTTLVARYKTARQQAAKRGCIFRSKTKQKKKAAIADSLGREKYECIVYTKNAQALRDSGIIINTALPNFATAVATLDQVLMMAAMDQVTHIAKSSEDRLHTDH